MSALWLNEAICRRHFPLGRDSAAVMQWLTACLLQGKMHIKKGKADTPCGYTFVGVLPCKDSRGRSLVRLHFKTGLYFSLGECCMSQHREALRSENFQVRPLIHCIVPDRSISYFLARTSWLGGHLCVAWGHMPTLEGSQLSGVGLSSPMVPSGSCCWKKKKLSPEVCMSFVLKQKPGGELASKQKFQQSWGPVLRLTPCPPFLSSTGIPRLITLF